MEGEHLSEYSFIMEHKAVHLLDLPDEILLIIMKKLGAVDVLHSLLSVNKRIDKMAKHFTHTKYLDFSTMLPNGHSRSASCDKLKRFCHHILPQTCQNLEELIVHQQWMYRILLACQYPNLRKISIINCVPSRISKYSTGM
jgi:hypothetical protein